MDPVTIAAVMYVTQHDQLSPMRDLLERTLVAAWSLDEKSNYGSEGLNISLGIMQIKPVTLQTTAAIRDRTIRGLRDPYVSWSGNSK